jgi:hypothetical protein
MPLPVLIVTNISVIQCLQNGLRGESVSGIDSNLCAHQFTIPNKEWEDTIGVSEA